MMPPNKEQRKRLQRWLDLGKKLRDHGPDLVERVPSPSTVFEGYCNGTLIPHFHVGIRSSALAKNPQQFCVNLEAGRKRERFVGESGFGARHPKITVSGYTHTDVPGVLGEDRLNLSVLVPTYEVVEQEKGVKLFDVEPTVRLVVLDDCRVGGLDSGHSPLERSGEILTLTGNDELRRACAPEFGFGAPADEVVSQVVESGAKVRERVADNELHSGGASATSVVKNVKQFESGSNSFLNSKGGLPWKLAPHASTLRWNSSTCLFAQSSLCQHPLYSSLIALFP